MKSKFWIIGIIASLIIEYYYLRLLTNLIPLIVYPLEISRKPLEIADWIRGFLTCLQVAPIYTIAALFIIFIIAFIFACISEKIWFALIGLKREITSLKKRKSYYPRKHKSKTQLIKRIIGFLLIIIFIGGLYHYRAFVIPTFLKFIGYEAPEISLTPTQTLVTTPTPTPSVEDAEKEAFRLINQVREQEGLLPTEWSEELYKLSKAHTQEMANQGKLFHTPMGASYAENCWGGEGYYRYSMQELPKVIVDSWMSSPLHKAWILHAPIRTSVVSIVITPTGQYASWTFWMGEAGEGPPLVRELANQWMQETGGSIPWIDWLKMKGYL